MGNIQIFQFSHAVSMNLLQTTIGERVCIVHVEDDSIKRTQSCAGVIIGVYIPVLCFGGDRVRLLAFRCLVFFSLVDSRFATALLKEHSDIVFRICLLPTLLFRYFMKSVVASFSICTQLS